MLGCLGILSISSFVSAAEFGDIGCVASLSDSNPFSVFIKYSNTDGSQGLAMVAKPDAQGKLESIGEYQVSKAPTSPPDSVLLQYQGNGFDLVLQQPNQFGVRQAHLNASTTDGQLDMAMTCFPQPRN
jgi:hypothetical protein